MKDDSFAALALLLLVATGPHARASSVAAGSSGLATSAGVVRLPMAEASAAAYGDTDLVKTGVRAERVPAVGLRVQATSTPGSDRMDRSSVSISDRWNRINRRDSSAIIRVDAVMTAGGTGADLPAGTDISSAAVLAAEGVSRRRPGAESADTVNVRDFGAIPDLQYLSDTVFTTTAGSRIIGTSPAKYYFDATSVGKTLIFPNGQIAKIIAAAGTSATLAAPATATIAAGTRVTLELGTDNTAAINRATATARSFYVGDQDGQRRYHAVLLFPPAPSGSTTYGHGGEYLTVGSIDLTGIVADGFSVFGYGARIHSAAAGQVAVDMISTDNMRWGGLSIYGDKYAQPHFGLQIGRVGTTNTNSSDNHEFRDFTVSGYYAADAAGHGGAALMNENAEETAFYTVHFINNAPNGFAVIEDGVNHWPVSSQFVRWKQPPEGGQSFDANTFISCIFGTGLSATNTTPLWIADAHELRIIASYASNSDGPYAAILYSANGTSLDQPQFDFHSETGTLTDNFLITGPAGVDSFMSEGMRFIEGASFARNSIFKIDPKSSIKKAYLPNADIDITTIPSGANGKPLPTKLFDSPASWKTSGRVFLPTGTMTRTLGAFTGLYCTGMTCVMR